jgi:hypothetical protein
MKYEADITTSGIIIAAMVAVAIVVPWFVGMYRIIQLLIGG